MKNKLYIMLLSTILLGTSSCKKYLNAKSDASLVTPEKLADFSALLDNQNIMNLRITPCFQETSSDDYFLLPSTYRSFPEGQQKYYQWEPYYYNFSNDWSKGYQAIFNSNLCLEGLAKIPETNVNTLELARIKGSAYFYRSFYMTGLLWNHAKAYDAATAEKDLGIVLKLNSDINENSVRASVAQCYQQVLKDVLSAIRLLPNYEQSSLRPSKVAAYALAARIYMSMRDYPKMYSYADSSLMLKNSLIDYNGDADINGNISGTVPFKKFNKETIFYTEMNSSFALHVPSRAKIDTILYATYESHDLRKTAFFRANSGYQQFKGSYASSPALLFSGIGVDEVLLMHAEGHARAGRIAEAMKDLNTLLIKRYNKNFPYVPVTAASQEITLNRILLERRKELIMRGLRWIDIKRLNKEGFNIIPKRKTALKEFMLSPNDPYYALPLPYDLIELTGMQQN
nr:RagB/SusD family nutrient uptake outer membrane protein [Pseudopedobacter sp.]